MTSRVLAEKLSVAKDEEAMYEAENAILDYLEVPLDETERGLSKSAVAAIESFMSENLGREWTYAELARIVS